MRVSCRWISLFVAGGGLLLSSAASRAEPASVAAATYDPGDGTLEVFFQSGVTAVHTGVPVKVYDAFSATGNDAVFYEEQVVPRYPPQVEDKAQSERDLGPVDEEYVASLTEVSPELLQLCREAIDNAVGAGTAAVRGIEKLARRAEWEGDGNAAVISETAKNALYSAQWSIREARRRFERQEYKKAHGLLHDAAHKARRLLSSLTELTPRASSVSIRDQHRASHYISAYSSWLDVAERQLRALRNVVEPSVATDASAR